MTEQQRQMYELSDELLKVRTQKKHNQYDAAKIMGISRASLIQFESGKMENPTIGHLSSILNYMGYELKIEKKA